MVANIKNKYAIYFILFLFKSCIMSLLLLLLKSRFVCVWGSISSSKKIKYYYFLNFDDPVFLLLCYVQIGIEPSFFIEILFTKQVNGFFFKPNFAQTTRGHFYSPFCCYFSSISDAICCLD